MDSIAALWFLTLLLRCGHFLVTIEQASHVLKVLFVLYIKFFKRCKVNYVGLALLTKDSLLYNRYRCESFLFNLNVQLLHFIPIFSLC